MLVASTQRTIGLVLFPIVAVAIFVYLLVNMRQAKAELGNELELAPNMKPYYADEDLEGVRLDRYLSMALGLLAIVAVGLPLYWLAEPGRQSGAIDAFDRTFAKRGLATFEENCASCHAAGAVGGSAPYVLADKEGKFVENRTWTAPALNNVLLRYDRDEVRFVLDHGRAFSPMQPWSVVGGGAMNAQQIDNIIDYLESITITPEQARLQIEDSLEAMRKEYPDASEGELLFNLQGAAGSYSCARCHTAGESFGSPGPDGGGAFGPNLWEAADKFRDEADLAKFLSEGCETGKVYGVVAPDGGQAQCKGGMMPAFGQTYTAEQLDEVAAYVAELDGSQQFSSETEG